MIEIDTNSAGALLERLTPRQREILDLMARGLTNEEIGEALRISPTTARTHITAVLSKLEVSNRTEAVAAFLSEKASPLCIGEVLRRPAIAVLPFLTLADDVRARAIAGGIAHDLAALFARWCWFPVIASASTMGARFIGDTSQEVGKRLGARFIVDGTIQIVDLTFRLTVRIDDADNGGCLWTERYELPCGALFELQDEVCEAIVATAYPMLALRVQLGLRQAARPGDLAARELAHQGMRLHAAREEALSAAAIASFEEAIEREPVLVLAYYGLGLTSYDQVLNQWGEARSGGERLLWCAERCLALAPHAAEGHYLLGRYHQTEGDHRSALIALEAAVARNPSFAVGHTLLAQVLQLTGRSDESLERMKQAIRLSPRSFVAGLATLHFARGEYAEALEAAERAVASNPRYPYAQVVAAASAWWLGETARALEHARVLRAEHPQFVPAGFLRTFGVKVCAVERIAKALEQLKVR